MPGYLQKAIKNPLFATGCAVLGACAGLLFLGEGARPGGFLLKHSTDTVFPPAFRDFVGSASLPLPNLLWIWTSATIVLILVGLGVLGSNLRSMNRNLQLELKVKRSFLELASDIDLVSKFNEAVISELRIKAKEDSTIEIVVEGEEPPHERTLNGQLP
ncbi:hypothetical protein IVA98_28995 [Bradyrhizobium sp. 160]|uniref:hypothetical protein n=1 Tax=Bradyrhizobium sp. 160 TaxID=2782634 RepID=UPI001FF89538|nr:hypothetical protein [Bradyrhizobium sp. 160]MCK1627093.1 hypothetical protein [Bradyrhizobium sp. 160]